MKKLLTLVSLFTVLFTTAQPQDTLYVWKAGLLVNIQSIKTADMDSITFKRPVNPNGINIPGPNVTDIDGNVYASVTNCGLTFTKQNLNVTTYSDGTPIPQVTDQNAFVGSTTGAWCYYNNDPANGAVYGKLYNWYAAAGIYDAASLANPTLRKKLAPTGWHIPSDAEWTTLTTCLGGEPVAGGKMKETGTAHWTTPNTGATNYSGFTALPGAYRDNVGAFYLIGLQGYWWSSSEANGAWSRRLIWGSASAYRNNSSKGCGFSVRCLRD
jgi:uncharacterized protein (TIGR02145 family)